MEKAALGRFWDPAVPDSGEKEVGSRELKGKAFDKARFLTALCPASYSSKAEAKTDFTQRNLWVSQHCSEPRQCRFPKDSSESQEASASPEEAGVGLNLLIFHDCKQNRAY